MNLNDIMQAAQGGQGVNNLAAQFGLTPEQAQAAIQAMMPAFSQGLQNAFINPGALSTILAQMANATHQGGYLDPNQTNAAAGGNVLGQIFGNPQIAQQISQHVAQMSGLNAQIVQEMMPAVASILMGGLTHNMNNQGLGGILGELANAATAPGGLGAAVGGAQGGAPQQGGLGGLIGSMLGGLFGSGPNSPQATAMQAGLNTLSSMLQAGVQVSQTHQQGLNQILQSLSAQLKS